MDEGDPGDVWENLRPSEARRLRQLTDHAINELASDLEQRIITRLTVAVLTFAAEYPDAPRCKPQLSIVG